jgi:CheY-like chemotaxis protein
MNLSIASRFKVGILKGVQILVVDNDVNSGVVYTIFLEHFGANVITASSIKEALKILTWFVPHILICEIRFLGESVYTLLNRLTAMEAGNKNHIPIIVTSTCATGTIDQIPEIEFEGYLLKPIDLDKLVVVIENQLQPGINNSLVKVDSSLTVSKLTEIKLCVSNLKGLK